MFTGLVEEAGQWVALHHNEGDARTLVIEADKIFDDVKLGDSVSVNGCCLTVAKIEGKCLHFNLLQETLKCTNLGNMKDGRFVNLERSLRADARLGGHFVSGHVDAKGKLVSLESQPTEHALEIEFPPEFAKFLVPKGSIAIDGISLTLGKIEGDRFGVWVIPHTWEVTALRDRKVGDFVNLEFDLLAKYVDRILSIKN
jgi:riboflavin synthase